MAFFGSGVTDPAGAAPTYGRSAESLGLRGLIRRIGGVLLLLLATAVAFSLLSWSMTDPSLTHPASGGIHNWIGPVGAIISDLLVQMLGLASIAVVLPPAYWALTLANSGQLNAANQKLLFAPLAALFLALACSSLTPVANWPLRHGYGGMLGDFAFAHAAALLSLFSQTRGGMLAGLLGAGLGAVCLQYSFGLTRVDLKAMLRVRADRTGFDGVRAVSQPGSQAGSSAATLAIDPQPWAQHTAASAQGMPAAAGAATTVAGAGHGPIHVHVHPAPVWAPPYGTPHPEAVHSPVSAVLGAAPERQSARAEASPQPNSMTRQAWLRPFPHRQPGASKPVERQAAHEGSAPVDLPETDAALDADETPATGRSHEPDFDHQTDKRSRMIAARFAPKVSIRDLDAESPQELVREVRPEPRPGAAAPRRPAVLQHPDELYPAAERARPAEAVRPVEPPPAPHREPSIIMPAETAKPVGGVTIAPGGFYDRLTGGRVAQQASYQRPSLNLLKRLAGPASAPAATTEALRERSLQLLETLADFGIKGDIVAVRPGPVVTLFEFEPARGTKSSRVIGLADDVARSMSARAVRIAVVPGVNAIGIELPNASREPVSLRDLLESQQFRKNEAKLPLALGRSIGGEPVVADLARMPHLLVAGTTGAGKSVGVNAMILSLLYQLSPDDCRLILIDPKMLELSVYNGIPHLLTPVVTEPNKAVAALNWAVGEMESRYRRMSALSVRNIDVFNARVRSGERRETAPELGSDGLEPMPHIVIVVDEFADLMAVAGKEIEFAVQRLAQMARAAGIHLIMATQRPSVDIITGTIKANFPTRISFRVASRIDSRTILNEQGAEQLLGQGDMLYTGGSGVMRVHGPFVSDEEVEGIATYLRSTGTPDYVEGLTAVPDPEGAGKAAEAIDEDDLYDRAVALVRADRKPSISYLQRKLGIGYNRAAGLIDRMQDDGLVGPPNSAGRRELIVDTDGEADPA